MTLADQEKIQQLIRDGVEAARAGDKAKAQALFQQAADQDENNERVWLWLANVTDDPQQKRVYIENVLGINPDNDRAQQMLLQLKRSGKPNTPDEIVPGLSRRAAYVYGGSIAGVWLALMILFLSIGINRRAQFNQELSATQQVIDNTEQAVAVANTEFAMVETNQAGTTIALEATSAILTATSESATSQASGGGGIIIEGRATLPPTFTPIPSATPLPGLGPTATPLAAIPPEDVTGTILLGYGGQDRLNVGFYPMIGYQLDTGTERQLGDFFVNNAAINPANGQEIVYTRYYPETFDFGIELSNLSATNVQRIADAWEPLDFLLELEQVSFSPDGSKLTFVAPTTDTGSIEVYYLDLNFTPTPGQSPLRRITRDAADYSYPAISPDNTRIAAIKTDPQQLDPGPDITVIEIDGGLQQVLKQDGSANLEEYPAWEPSGNALAYASKTGTEGATLDIIRLNLANPGAPAQFLVRNTSANATRPVYSPDGRYLAFASDLTFEYNIYILELETGEVFQVTNDNDNPNFPGGWFQPGVVSTRPQVLIPTPITGGG